MSKSPEKWGFTQYAKEQFEGYPGYRSPTPEAPNGEYQGRHVIGHDTPINGGVVIGSSNDALVIDDKNQPELDRLYEELLQNAHRRSAGRPDQFKADILGDVLRLVENRLRNDVRATLDLSNQVRPNTKVAISKYLNAGVGICLHQALVAAYLLERLKSQGLIRGEVILRRPVLDSNDLSRIHGTAVADLLSQKNTVGVGHAFVEYRSSAGDIFIIDPMTHYVGLLDQTSPEQQSVYRAPRD